MKNLIAVAAAIAGILRVVQGSDIEPFESQHSDIHKSWELIGKSDPDSSIALTIALSNPNDEAFEDLAYDIATPFSQHYRKHLTAEELADWVKPPDRSVEDVKKWLNNHGIHGVLNHDLLEAKASVSQAEALLNTSYHLYRHRESGIHVNRVERYHVPNTLKDAIELITPTVTFPRGGKDQKDLDITAEVICPAHGSSDETHMHLPPDPKDLKTPCNYYADPTCVRHLYNVTYTPQLNTTASTAIFLFYSGGPNLTDLQIYLRNFNLGAYRAGAAPTLIKLARGDKFPHTGDEENLDSQMVTGLSWPAKSTFAFTGVNAYVWGPEPHEKHEPSRKVIKFQEDVYLKYYHSLIHNKTVPYSATDSELYIENGLSHRYMKFLCNKIYARAGARGISVFFPSGDGGTYAPLRYHTPAHEKIKMGFPATCPWITAVGATFFVDGVEKSMTYNSSAGHLGVVGYPSSGGFSNVFARPKYQEKFVEPYLRRHHIRQKFSDVQRFNPNGRGFPDIAALGQRVPFIYNSRVTDGDGTSVSSPIAAALFTLLSDYEASKGRPALGFLNPWLYSHPDVLNDITEGGPNFPFFCCNTSVKSCTKSTVGYPTAKGWDAVTGLGSINLQKMMDDLDDMAKSGALGAP